MNNNDTQTTLPPQPAPAAEPASQAEQAEQAKQAKKPLEFGGPKGPEPTRYGDWEKAGRCIDF